MPQTILVVDDDPDLLKLCQTFLKAEGFTILSAEGSSDALKLCKQHEGSIDLLLTDLVLPPPGFSLASGDNEFPHVHGYELAVRAVRMRQGLRVLLMSANIEKELHSYGIRKGCLPFLTKPFEHAAMLKTVRDTLAAPAPTVDSLLQDQAGGAKGADEWFD